MRFGTDGIRGRANREVTANLALALGGAVVAELGPRVLVAHDGRPSGPMLEAAVVAGVAAAGGSATRAGVLPTPGLSWLVAHEGYAAGVMITASHNPAEDNGLKVVDARGEKPGRALRSRIEAALSASSLGGVPAPAAPAGSDRVGTIATDTDAGSRFVRATVAALVGVAGDASPLRGRTLVVDCANGAGVVTAPDVLRQLGAEVELIGGGDGAHINDGCGVMHPARLVEAVRRLGADAGLALDGDGDRVLLVDATGRLCDGDALLWLGVGSLLAAAERPAAVVGTVMTNVGLERALEALEIPLLRTAVGDTEVAAGMSARALPLGGEPSGHLLWREGPPTADGLYAGIRALLPDPRTLPARLVGYRPCAQVHRILRLEQRALPALPVELISAWEARGARVVVRPSGTEPVMRIMVEHDDPSTATTAADELLTALRAGMGSRGSTG